MWGNIQSTVIFSTVQVEIIPYICIVIFKNCKNIAARAAFIYNILYIKVVRAVMLCKNHAVTHRYYTAFIKQRFAFGFRHTIFWL